MTKKKQKLRVVSTNPAVLSANPAPQKELVVTLLFEVDDPKVYEGADLLSAWINGTFDNADFSEDVGFPPGLGQPMVVGVEERNCGDE